ncbi:hypothetical protein BDL97_01G171600 [Sphagnum fallax]|nr:hypothetical protein BDL97_01G171600 [Sphagnum fallax]KAH8975688.1 hypothetical protein BDL97_01G171600 [Sphagnum fallax]KAH8975689.1 hypothetical protein BDL97_01G171600 [Sphagnum fallax]
MGFEIEEHGKLVGGMENSSTLFEKVVPVRVNKANSEDRHMDLTARFIMGLSKIHRTTKVLQVQITNELDPFFFYSLEVNEDDFQSLKVEQCILVDFATFPYKFIELLEQCIASASNDSSRGTGRFLAVLHIRTGDSTFTVVETNQFKHLSHLSLVFRQGNDSVIKQFLAGRLAEYKSINGDLHEKLRRTLHSLERALRDVNNLSSELGELKENHCRIVSELKAEYTLELAHEKEKVMQETIELKDQHERDRAEFESHCQQQVDHHRERANELDKQVRSLLDSKYKLESRILELNTKLTSTEKGLEEKSQDYEQLKMENQSLDSDKHDAAKQLNLHLMHLSALEQEVSNKSELLSSLKVQLDSQVSQRVALEGSWKEAQAAAERADERANFSATELAKCHQIIEKLQVELRSSKQKVKLKGQLASQQDSLLTERQAVIEKVEADNLNLRSELDTLKVEQGENKKKVEDLTSKLEETQELLKSNQQMIQWLNQQLTEAQLGKMAGSGASSRYNTFTRPNINALCYSSCLASSRAAEASTPLSSNSGNSASVAFKSQFPMSSLSYLSSTTIPVSGTQNKTQPLNSLGAFNSSPSVIGSQCFMYTAKCASQAGQRVQYKPKMGLTATSTVASSTNPGLYTACTKPMDSPSLNFWDDSGAWASKQNILPRPQLSFADRSGHGNHNKHSSFLSRPTGNHAAGFNGQSNSVVALSPNQESPPKRQSPPTLAGEGTDFSNQQEDMLAGTSGRGENRMPMVSCNHAQDANGTANTHHLQSPHSKINHCPSTPPQQSVSKNHGQESLVPSHPKNAKSPTKSPPDCSPLKNRFVCR